jgi:hypothetical protein
MARFMDSGCPEERRVSLFCTPPMIQRVIHDTKLGGAIKTRINQHRGGVLKFPPPAAADRQNPPPPASTDCAKLCNFCLRRGFLKCLPNAPFFSTMLPKPTLPTVPPWISH